MKFLFAFCICYVYTFLYYSMLRQTNEDRTSHRFFIFVFPPCPTPGPAKCTANSQKHFKKLRGSPPPEILKPRGAANDS